MEKCLLNAGVVASSDFKNLDIDKFLQMNSDLLSDIDKKKFICFKKYQDEVSLREEDLMKKLISGDVSD